MTMAVADFAFPKEWKYTANQIIAHVSARMIGRIADMEDGTLKMLIAVTMAGGGDHLEIGTLFGGSAIAAALMKKAEGLAGKVVCVDPLNGFYRKTLGKVNDPITLIPINRETFEINLTRFNVEDRIELIAKYSDPWPWELEDRMFASAYIDGEHHGNGPMNDWLNIRDRVISYVVFDNCDQKHPAVVRACDFAAQDPNWREVHRGGITCILERA